MKTIIIAILCIASPALAWDGPGMWYRAADDANPGGGGILGTGGQHDYHIKCGDCHVMQPSEPGLQLQLAYNPQLVNGTFVAGTKYTVTATLAGAINTCAPGPNGGGTTKVNSFAASYEDDTGAPAGTLQADSAACRTILQPTDPGTTTLDGDCAVIFGKSNPNITRWTFYWTAPASGTVHVYWGAVDGNCDMMSMGDGVTNGSATLAAPPALGQTLQQQGRDVIRAAVAIGGIDELRDSALEALRAGNDLANAIVRHHAR